MLNATRVFAIYIIRETVHTKIVPFALLLFAATLAVGNLFAHLMIGNPIKVTLDFTLLAYQLFILGFIAIFVVPYFNKPTRLVQFAPWLVPIAHARVHLLLGALLGFTALLALTGLSYFLVSLLLINYQTGFWTPHLGMAFGALFIEGFYLLCAALMFSLLLPQAIAYCALCALYLVGYAQPTVVMYLHKHGLPWASIAANYLLPDLTFLDIKNQVLYQLPFDKAPFLLAAVYTITLGFMFLCSALGVFGKKNL